MARPIFRHGLHGTVFTGTNKKLFVMEKMVDLKDLLKHEIQDLMSAEDQIIEALPMMIEKAQNAELKKGLRQHLKVTEAQRKRLDKAQKLISKENGKESNSSNSKGLFERLFSGTKCKGMEGLITEGQKVMGEDMNQEVMDAAIIGCAQKIEHYEISSYGTAKAFAQQLQMREVEKLLDQTLKEEYMADELLNKMAIRKLNAKAKEAGSVKGRASSNGRSASNGKSSSRSKSNTKSGTAKSSGKSTRSSSAKSASKNSGRSGGRTKASSKSKKSGATSR